VPVLEQVLEAYPEKVKVAFKHFPLKSHKFAVQAAMASLAAERQGKFWEYHDRLFENYNKLNDEKIREIAAGLEMNLEAFEKELKNPENLARVRQDLKDGGKAGVKGTPVVFVNGKKLTNRTLKGFRAAVDQALRKLEIPDPPPTVKPDAGKQGKGS
jgi:protein-disulfide isomerase